MIVPDNYLTCSRRQKGQPYLYLYRQDITAITSSIFILRTLFLALFVSSQNMIEELISNIETPKKLLATT